MSKYGNTKVKVDGIVFDSKKEASYYMFLKEEEAAGNISDLRLQVPFVLIPAVWKKRIKHMKTKNKEETYCAQRAVKYVADFVYVDNATGKEEVVDVKSAITRKNKEYVLKKKMMFAFNDIEIVEI